MKKIDKENQRDKNFLDFVLNTLEKNETNQERELRHKDYVSNKDLYAKLNSIEKANAIKSLEELRDEFELDIEKEKKNTKKVRIMVIACLIFALINIIFIHCDKSGNLVTFTDAVFPIIFSIYLAI